MFHTDAYYEVYLSVASLQCSSELSSFCTMFFQLSKWIHEGGYTDGMMLITGTLVTIVGTLLEPFHLMKITIFLIKLNVSLTHYTYLPYHHNLTPYNHTVHYSLYKTVKCVRLLNVLCIRSLNMIKLTIYD